MSNTPAQWRWSRPVPTRLLDAWLERLAFIDSTRLSVVEKPNAKSARIEVYPETQQQGQELVEQFGGTLREVRPREMLLALQPREPIVIGRHLILCSSFDQAVEAQVRYPRRLVLHLPAGLAFGTGEHETTRMILARLMTLPQFDGLTVADVGTGSGLLALVLRARHARHIDAIDNDAQAVRVARENETLNFPTPAIRWHHRDLGSWRPRRSYHLITANLFLETLVAFAPQLAALLHPGGILLTSGLLNAQAAEAAAAYQQQGLELLDEESRGKWTMHLWQKPPAAEVPVFVEPSAS